MADNAVWTITTMWGWGAPAWSILFFNGNDWRMTNVTFIVDSSITSPSIVMFESEYPFLQYDILITGPCIGQPWPCNSDGPQKDGGQENTLYF